MFRESSLAAMQRERDQIDRGLQTVTHGPNLAHHLFWYGRVLRMAFIFIMGDRGEEDYLITCEIIGSLNSSVHK